MRLASVLQVGQIVVLNKSLIYSSKTFKQLLHLNSNILLAIKYLYKLGFVYY